MNWDHLRFFLAVARAGSFAGAARALGVNHSTVFRRINTFEESLGVRLVDRQREGYSLTAVGEDVFEHASRVEESIMALNRSTAGRDRGLTGDIRMTTAANLATEFVAPALARFRRKHPGIRVEVSVSDSDYDLARREADLALRATPAPPEYLVGRRVVRLPWFVYGSSRYLKRRGRPERTSDLAAHELVGGDESFRRMPIFDWLHSKFTREQFVATAGDLNTMAAMVVSGMGLGILPADQRKPGMERLFPVEPEFITTLWLLTHADLRGVARIRAFSDHLFDELRADKRLTEFTVAASSD